jgi:hypothetical protein
MIQTSERLDEAHACTHCGSRYMLTRHHIHGNKKGPTQILCKTCHYLEHHEEWIRFIPRLHMRRYHDRMKKLGYSH